jgi:hypothetical protein
VNGSPSSNEMSSVGRIQTALFRRSRTPRRTCRSRRHAAFDRAVVWPDHILRAAIARPVRDEAVPEIRGAAVDRHRHNGRDLHVEVESLHAGARVVAQRRR